MEKRLSFDSIDSFCGNVVSLRLLEGETPVKAEWSAEGDAVRLRTFAHFDGGVLLVMEKPGTACVKAVCGTETFLCPVSVRPMTHTESGEDLNYYNGDFHTHTSNDHTAPTFAVRTFGFPEEMARDIGKEHRMDFGVVSDHACVLNDADFFRGFIAADEKAPENVVIFAGSESEISEIVYDRYGIRHKNGGEIVTLNTDGYKDTSLFTEYLDEVTNAPAAIASLAHPQVMGSSVAGIWNFDLAKNNTERMKHMVRFVEMGNGTDRDTTPLFEHTLSVALDQGYRVSTCCTSDHHGPTWGADIFPGKTIIMAKEKSKEAFLDAIRSNRAYATEAGNVKLFYEVNGQAAPADLKDADRCTFHVKACHLDGTPAPEIKSLEVITDYEQRAAKIENVDFSDITFTVKSSTASYFYLRLVDDQGRKTWSTPVWTGRKTAQPPKDLRLQSALDFSAFDAVTGTDATILFNGTPREPWRGAANADLRIDLKETKKLRAVGVLPKLYGSFEELLPRPELFKECMSFPCKIRLSGSADGETFFPLADGYVRIFGGESIFFFDAASVRYLRLEILETAGKTSCLPQFTDLGLVVGEIEVYE